MSQPPTKDQLLNLADRAERGRLTPEEAARLRQGIALLATNSPQGPRSSTAAAES